jgi:sugar phosphate isomerase/epimerase
VTAPLNRREWLAVAAGGAATITLVRSAPADTQKGDPFVYCLNTSTISGQKLGIEKNVEIAAAAGYAAIEPWIRELNEFTQAGKSLKDLGKRIRDAGLTVPSAIGFAEWIVDDESRRRKGLDQAKRDMDMVAQLGGTRLAAPPVGATGSADISLPRIAERYRALLELGDTMGVTPQAEIWGFSKTLAKLSEAAMIAVECGHPKACILPDIYHLHKGGSGFPSLKLLGGAAIGIFHMNDYPKVPPRESINDSHRVYPGDGVAPLAQVIRDLARIGYRGALSLELFNRDYWKQDALLVARTGLEKMKAVVRAAIA